MQGKIMFALGAAVGYVVGTRSGREAYDRLKNQANEFWHDPRVQQKFSEAQEFAKEKMPLAGEKISQATKKVTDRQKQNSNGDGQSGGDENGNATNDFSTSASGMNGGDTSGNEGTTGHG